MAEITTEKRDSIQKQAKKIMDNFAKALDKIKDLEETRVERAEDRRAHREGKEPDSEFRKIVLKNAPKTKEGYIEAEKGGWV